MERMKDFYISECTRHENKIITSNFVVVSKQIKPKKTGEPYLALPLATAADSSKPKCGTTWRKCSMSSSRMISSRSKA
jgi:hypothetical protein